MQILTIIYIMLNKVWGVLDVGLPHQITRNNEGVGDSLFLQRQSAGPTTSAVGNKEITFFTGYVRKIRFFYCYVKKCY